jgi:endonuclease VIII
VPEGDTVFLTGRRLDDALAGRTLVRAELRHPRLSTTNLAGRAVLGVATVGKHLLTRFDDGRTLHSHLRLDGSWHLYRPGQPWHGGPMHTVRAVLATTDRVAVGYRLHDLELVPTSEEDRLVGHLGPDLLATDWDDAAEAEAVRRLTAAPDTPIGLALLDQTAMAGVGNLYRVEICFLLGVSPWTPVAEVDVPEAVRLARRLLLLNAWRPEQATTGDLRGGAQQWVYARAGRACRRCGSRVRSTTMSDPALEGAAALSADRTVYFCPTCQRGPLPRRRTGAGGGTSVPRTPTRRRTARSTG